MKLNKQPPDVQPCFGMLESRSVLFLRNHYGKKSWETGVYIEGWEDESPDPHWQTNAGFNIGCEDVEGWIELPPTEIE